MGLKNISEFRNIWFWFFLLSFSCIILLSFLDIEQSYSPLKYNGPADLDKLLIHYNEYKTNFKIFLHNTYIFHEGDTEGSKNSFFFLYPLFIGVDLLGGLNFGNLYRITVIFGLSSIAVLFLFLKRYWTSPIAFFSCLFYGLSPWFQELFRAETYHGPSVLIALLILYAAFKLTEKENNYHVILSFILGLTVGISYYYYGMLRGLILFVGIVLWQVKSKKLGKICLFLTGMLLVLAWGIYLRSCNGGPFFDAENFLAAPAPWVSLLKRPFLIFYQIFTSNVIQASSPSHLSSHSRLLHPVLFIPFILGLLLFIVQKQKNNKLFNLFSLILFLSILITNHCQVRRMVLMIIPIYIYTGVGVSYIYTLLQKMENIKLASALKGIFIIMIIFVILSQIAYIKHNILESERTFGFLRVGQEVKRQDIQGKILLLMDDSQKPIHEVKDQLFIKLENYEKFSTRRMEIKTIDFYKLKRILLNQYLSKFCLVITPFCESIMVERWIMEHGLQIYEKAKIQTPPALKTFAEENNREIKNDYFKILMVEGRK